MIRRRLVLSAPLRSGVFLLDVEHREFLASSLAFLRSSSDPKWSFPEAHRHVDQLVHGPTTPENAGFLPDAVAVVRDREMDTSIQEWADGLERPTSMVDASLSFLSIGVALFDVQLEWSADLDGEPDLRQLDADILAVVSRVGPRIGLLLDQFRQVVDATNARTEPAGSVGSNPWRSVREARSGILWVHRTYVQVGGNEISIRPPSVYKRVEYGDLTYTPGIDWSTIHIHQHREEPDWILRITRLCEAYLAVMEDIDKSVYLLLARTTADYDTIAARDVARANEEVLEFVRAATLLRARLETAIVALGAGSIWVWRQVADVQSWYHIQANTSRNLSALKELIDSRHSELESHRSRTLNIIAMVLTLSGLVATLVAVISFVFGGELSSLDLIRVLVIAVTLVGSGLFVYRLVRTRLL